MSNIIHRSVFVAVATLTLACGLGGCSTVNGYLASGMSDNLPHWAGGLPPDAPPRPGSAKYDDFMRERERKRLEAAPPKNETGASPASLAAIH
jgi:hypothetical protein